MAEFLRPAVREALWRWRDVIVALGVGALGLWWVLGTFGIVYWLGWGLIALSVLLLAAGVQRGRFRRGGGGPGVVSLDEGRLSYFGPLTGGAIPLAEIDSVVFDPVGAADGQWIVTGLDRTVLAIPMRAAGAEVLFDALNTLPGLRTQDVLAVLSSPPRKAVTVWQRESIRLT